MDDQPRGSRHVDIPSRPRPTSQKRPRDAATAAAITRALDRHPNLSPARIAATVNATQDEVRYVMARR